MIQDLLVDNVSVAGRLVTTAAILLIAILLAFVIGRLAGRRADDTLTRYHLRKGVRYVDGGAISDTSRRGRTSRLCPRHRQLA